MKNLAIRSFVIALALVGFGATSFTSSARTTEASATKISVQVPANVVSTPPPVCAPSDPNACGIM